VRLLPRRRGVPVKAFDEVTGRWRDVDTGSPVDRSELTISTYNVWNDSRYAEQRYRAIAQLLSLRQPDIMAFQEVTPAAADILLSQNWIRDAYASAAVIGGHAGSYGMLMLSRLPLSGGSYTRLPTRQSRGFLQAHVVVNGARLVVCCIHLDSGKASSRLRGWQLRRIFRSLQVAEDVVVLGDFNMRDAENFRITAPYRDVWPELRADDDGFTEDTSINLMRYDMKDKHRHVRFDRVLLKSRRWTPTTIELLGTEPIDPALPRVFPSDHFGVQCRITVRNP
jgi:tyrosyl-DNA phosphodiesterase 2